ncbi:MAG: sn-glycerol-3-phosphate ABC transporter ATP-binding protein UgpC [Clostridiaceae bacterium]|nr:sn-glycerol-3-phosphate ABC transporter ATP-binding protein UgpC [Clostridiaceae bacterium]
MATLKLKNIRKVYPLERKKKKIFDKKSDQKDIQKTEDGFVAVQNFNIDIADNEFIVLVGPSGCGKSTTLRMIAGLEDITAGELYIDDQLVNDVAPKDRNIAMVFQNYALYPHMTVFENMAFSLTLQKEDKDVIREKVQNAAEILGVTEYLDRKPKALSGGQRQRVAIGRAIVRNPKVFLMDEPLSNLDAKLRNQMRAEIIQLREKIQTTFIYVTHDQTEAMTLGDRIVVMKDGYIQQIGTPQEVFEEPTNLFVASFIGSPQMNFFKGYLKKEGETYFVSINDKDFKLGDEWQKNLKNKSFPDNKPVHVGVRPEHMYLVDLDDDEPSLKLRLKVKEMMGSSYHLHFSAHDQEEVVVVTSTFAVPKKIRQKGLSIGSEMDVIFDNRMVYLFDPETELNLLHV